MRKYEDVQVDALRHALEEATKPGGRWSRRALSLAAGLGPDAVRDIISGKSKAPGFRTVVALADVLDISSTAFLGLSDEIADAPMVPILGAIEPGVWREEPLGDPSRAELIPAVVDIALPDIKRFAVRMVGLSMDELFVPDDVLYCEYTRENEVRLSAGHLGVILREKNGLYELTAREIAMNEVEEVALISRTTVPSLSFQKTVSFNSDYMAVDGDDNVYEVIGIIKGVYRQVRGIDRMRDVSRK
ncbi:helix-turn-helix domain-containing protein [Sphingomonas aurantiaca]|nr:helix-turn-helix transcriptional regulator [Sphingomonas aurantiaca]